LQWKGNAWPLLKKFGKKIAFGFGMQTRVLMKIGIMSFGTINKMVRHSAH